MEIVYLASGLLVGIFLGLLAFKVFLAKKPGIAEEIHNEVVKTEAIGRQVIETLRTEKQNLERQIEANRLEQIELHKKLSAIEARQPDIVGTRDSLKAEVASLQKTNSEQLKSISELSAKLLVAEASIKRLAEKLETDRSLVEQNETKNAAVLHNLANKIFDEKSKVFKEQAEKSIDNVLKPLKEKIGSFEKKVEEESKERFSLKNEITRLVETSDKMNRGTNSLVEALKGDSKVQGDWGEHLVEMILEAAGLVEGRDFMAQPTVEDSDGKRARPDFLVNLPQDKHLIIDSKVSLTHYAAYKQAQDDLVRQEFIAAHLKSIRTHIDDLAGRHYSKAKGVNSPDWVFMFVGVEPAYILAMQMDGEIFSYAQRKGVILVTASTLLASLRTVAYIWKLEKQQRNAQEIALEAGRLYDKFVGFLDDFEKIGKSFVSGQLLFETAMGKLKTGTGNIFRRMEGLKELGAAPVKRIKQELLDSADGNEQTSLEEVKSEVE